MGKYDQMEKQFAHEIEVLGECIRLLSGLYRENSLEAYLSILCDLAEQKGELEEILEIGIDNIPWLTEEDKTYEEALESREESENEAAEQ